MESFANYIAIDGGKDAFFESAKDCDIPKFLNVYPETLSFVFGRILLILVVATVLLTVKRSFK